MKLVKLTAFLGATLLGLFSLPATAGTATGKILGYIPYFRGSEKIFLINVENTSNTPACNFTSRFAMKSSDINYEATQAAVLAAFMAGTSVQVAGQNACNVWENSEDISYICFGITPC